MHVLITGGAGFVGRRLARRLLLDGMQVTVVDNLSAGIHPANWCFRAPDKDFRFDYSDVRDFFKRNHVDNFDTIFHCAAVVGGRLKIEGDPLGVATDLAIDADFFNWCAQSKTKKQKIVYFSSSAVYPVRFQTQKEHYPLNEAMVNFDFSIEIPDLTYGWAKLSGEYLAKHAVDKYELDVVIYRPFSGYGEDQSLDYPFPSIIKRVIDGEDPVVVWGSGDQVRDFIYIEDVIDCIFASMWKMRAGKVLNIGSGLGVSFVGLARAAGAKRVMHDKTKPEGVFYRVNFCRQ